MPAFATATSSPPWRSSIAATTASTCPESLTSQTTPIASCSAAIASVAIQTVAPSTTNRCTTPSPSPFAPPVTSARVVESSHYV